MAQWSIPFDRLARATGVKLDTLVRRSVFTIFSRVVLRSPVDTGRFRANWNVTLGQPNYNTTSSTSQARGSAEALKALSIPAGGVYWLANGLPYAQRLENGYSRLQAPQGMVRLSVVEFSQVVNGLART